MLWFEAPFQQKEHWVDFEQSLLELKTATPSSGSCRNIILFHWPGVYLYAHVHACFVTWSEVTQTYVCICVSPCLHLSIYACPCLCLRRASACAGHCVAGWACWQFSTELYFSFCAGWRGKTASFKQSDCSNFISISQMSFLLCFILHYFQVLC